MCYNAIAEESVVYNYSEQKMMFLSNIFVVEKQNAGWFDESAEPSASLFLSENRSQFTMTCFGITLPKVAIGSCSELITKFVIRKGPPLSNRKTKENTKNKTIKLNTRKHASS